jgi:hypothetical protein
MPPDFPAPAFAGGFGCCLGWAFAAEAGCLAGGFAMAYFEITLGASAEIGTTGAVRELRPP